jgi:general secretion pathway protein G
MGRNIEIGSGDVAISNCEPTVNTNRDVRGQKRERRWPGPHTGFTLIELMIVMALIVILAGIALAVYSNSQTRAKEAVLKENLFRMRDAIDQYYVDKNQYPSALDDLVSQKYLRAVPEDPFTNSTSTWQTVMSEIDAANPSAIPGVFDVKSGAEGMALDGSRYADW